MSACARRDEMAQALRAGQWPQGCAAELREHVAECAVCAEEARMLSAFAVARESAMRTAVPQSAELLWWKAQLRRRHDAMERLERPGLAIPTVTIAVSVVLLIAALAAAWKRVVWTQILGAFSSAGRNGWALATLAAVLFGFGAVALVVGLGSAKERG